MSSPTTHCGFIALLGRPNAGKSSLVNSLIGQKIVGVSQKPQTTRQRIVGNFTEGPHQLLFLDTPGLHHRPGRQPLNELMNAEAWGSIEEADLICYLVDVARGWHEEDDAMFGRLLRSTTKPVVVLATKVDKVKKAEVAEKVEEIKENVLRLRELESQNQTGAQLVNEEPLQVSAKRPEMLEQLRSFVKRFLPEGPFLFDPDQLTDRSQKFVVQEMVREQVFRLLQKELPYQTAVVVDKFEDKPDVAVIYCSIIVGRDSQKSIVIGKRGETIKLIGTHAREQLQKQLDKKVFLDLRVKVDHEWFERENKITEYSDL